MVSPTKGLSLSKAIGLFSGGGEINAAVLPSDGENLEPGVEGNTCNPSKFERPASITQ